MLLHRCIQNLKTSFSLSRDVKKDAKRKNGMVRVTQDHWKCNYLIKYIRLQFAFHRNYASVLYHFRDIACNLSIVTNFS